MDNILSLSNTGIDGEKSSIRSQHTKSCHLIKFFKESKNGNEKH